MRNRIMKFLKLFAALQILAGIGVSQAYTLPHHENYGVNFNECFELLTPDVTGAKCDLNNQKSACAEKIFSAVKKCGNSELSRQKTRFEKNLKTAGKIMADNAEAWSLLTNTVRQWNEFTALVKPAFASVTSAERAEAESVLYELAAVIKMNTHLKYFISRESDNAVEDYEDTRNVRYTYEERNAYPGMEKCIDSAVSMTDMYDCQSKGFSVQDQKLNKTYKKIMSGLKNNAGAKDAVRAMERKWVVYKEHASDYMPAYTGQGSAVLADQRSFSLEELMLQNILLERIEEAARR